jgi:SAM-dependent methyltransferase
MYCDPMPDAETLALMYGPDYQQCGDETIEDPKEPERTIGWLSRLGQGTFVDYGCGSGALLLRARDMGWTAVGVELDTRVSREVQERTGVRVVSNPTELSNGFADALHLGDVIEHLTTLDQQMPNLLRLLRPGGVLLAQGPLEAGPTLFSSMIGWSRALRPERLAEMAPYHVILATRAGQRTFFERMGLEELEYAVHEAAWPAPARLTSAVVKQPRSLALYALRRASQLTSMACPNRFGNRYFYAGRWST